MVWCFLEVFIFLLWNTETSKATDSSIIANIANDFRNQLEDMELEVLNQHSHEFYAIPDAPPIFQMPDDFMHAFRPNTGVGNREDLIIERLRELPIYDDGSFSNWRHFHFNNSDYLLGINANEAVLWKRNFDPDQPLDLSVYDSIFRYLTEQKGYISSTAMFTRRFQYVDVLHIAILIENDGNSFISIFEVIEDKALMVTTIHLGFNTNSYANQPLSKLVDLQARHGKSLVVLVSQANNLNVVYQQKGSGILNHYIELHYPNAIDMVSFTIGGHGYIAVANSTLCTILKMNEFVQHHFIFDTIYSTNEIVDLEYFRLGFNHYLVLSTKSQQILYIWKRGHFLAKQEFHSVGVVQAYGALLPNCRDDVILMLIKLHSPPDIFVWNGQKENFFAVTIDIPTGFQPILNTITSSSYRATAFILFVDGNNLSKLFAIDTRLSPISDPVLLFGKEVSNLMQDLQTKLKLQEAVIKQISSVLVNAVRPTGDQYFTALQIFNNLDSTGTVFANLGEVPTSVVWEGSSITLEDYTTGTHDLEAKLHALENVLNNLESALSDVVKIDEDATITGQKIFIGDVTGSEIIAQALNIEYAGGINVAEVQKQLYRLDKPTTIQGTLLFEKPLHVLGNLNVAGTINGLDLSKDVMTTNTDQESKAELFFKDLKVLGDLSLLGKINGIDINKEVITLHGHHVITGNKVFLGGIIVEDVIANVIDDVNMDRLFAQSLTKSGEQFIPTTKHFEGIVQTRNITLTGKLNSYNVKEFADNIVRIDVPSIIYGHKVFTEDVFINSLAVDKKINDLKIPDDLFLKDKSNVITGSKTFTGMLTVEKVQVDGSVNGLHLPEDVITLSKDESISTELHFQEGISVENNIIVNGLIDGVDLSRLAKDALTVNETNNIENAFFSGEVTVHGNINLKGFFNGMSINEIVNDIVFKTEKNPVITGPKYFTKIEANEVELNGLINGYNIQQDFMTISGDQTITGTKTFENSVLFHDVKIESGMINDVNLTTLYNNRITLSIEDQIIDGDIEFVDHIVVGDLFVDGTIGGLNFPHDFVLKSTNQVISNKEFTGTISVDDVIVSGNVELEGTLNHISLPEFLNHRITLSGDENIIGDLTFGDIAAKKVDVIDYVNGLDILEFANNIMSLSKDQNITGYKEFLGETKVYGSVITAEGINGISLANINKRVFKLLDDTTINGSMKFVDPLTLNNVNVRGFINGVNITKLDLDSIKTEGLQHIKGETIFHEGFHVEGDVIATSVNDLNFEDILTKSTDQIIKGTFTFKDLTVDNNLEVSGFVNGMDLSETVSLLAKNDESNVIYSNIIFKAPVNVLGDVEVVGFVNGMNLTEVERTAMLKSGSQHVVGHKILKGNVTVYGDVDVTFVNDVYWQDFLNDVVRIDKPQIITSSKTWFSDVEVDGDIHVSGLAEIELVNDVNLTQFVEDVVFVDRPAHISGTKVFSSPIEITGDLNADLINGLDLLKDVVILQCGDQKQIISGEKTFHNLTIYGDIFVDGYVNGYNLKELVANTLSITGDQIITGHKNFYRPLIFLKNVNPTTVNGLVISKDLVTLNTEQEIIGGMNFAGDMHVQGDVIISGLVNGVDLEALAENALYVNDEQEVEGIYHIDTAVAKSDIFVEGLVNGIDLTEFSNNVTDFWRAIHSDFQKLTAQASAHCEMVAKIHSYLEHSYYILDGFFLVDIINFPSDFASIDLSAGNLTLILTGNAKSTALAHDYLFNLDTNKFDYIVSRPIHILREKRYKFMHIEVTVQFSLIPRESVVLMNGIRISEIPPGYTDGDAVVQKNRLILALLYSTRNICEMYEIDVGYSIRPLGNLNINGVTSISLFEISDILHLALSTDSSPVYKERSKIYAHLKGDWQLLQNLPASASSRVHHFIFHGYHYLVFTNAIPVYKTKEPMAVQVYRNTEGDTVPFELFQKIPFDNAEILESFKFGDLSELYLVVASATKVQVFRLEGESGFKTTFTLDGKCIKSVIPFVLKSELYLIISQKDESSVTPLSTAIYKGLTQGWTLPSRKFEYCS